MVLLKVIRIGFKDGLAQPYEFNYGMTYESECRQWVYDWSSRFGQFIGKMG